MSKSLFYRASLASAALVGAWQAPSIAHAQQGVDANEIIVTAQKREQNIQDVGVAITALGQQQLEMLGTGDTVALTRQVPNLGVNTYSPSQTVFNIRGVAQNDFADGQEGPIAFYNDEVYVGSLAGISGQFFDLERVEVLRGPQGTLFGRNATGGLIQVVTAKPTDEFEGFVTVTGGSFDQFATEAAISGPLGEHVNGRLSFSSNNSDGYYDNTFSGRDEGDTNFMGVRGQLAFDLSPTNSLVLKAEYLRNDEEAGGQQTYQPAGFDANGETYALAPDEDFFGPGGPGSAFFLSLPASCPGCSLFGTPAYDDVYETRSDFPGLFDREYFNLSARFEHDFGWATLTSITAYQNINKIFLEDLDATPLFGLLVNAFQDGEQTTQELRLSGETERTNWVIGAFAMRINNSNPSFGQTWNPTYPTNPYVFNSLTGSTNVATIDSLALFAQGEFELNDQFTLIVGGRYSRDDKSSVFTPYELAATDPNGFAAMPDYHDGIGCAMVGPPGGAVYTCGLQRSFYPDETFDGFSGKVELDYQPNANTLIYASYNRGLKSGGFTTPNFRPNTTEELVFQNEVLIAYEAGYKLTLDDGRVRFNGSAFYYDYEDYQAFYTVGLNNLVTNYPAEVAGAELELFANPIDPLNLGVFVTYMARAEVQGFPVGFAAIPTDRRMPHTPEWTVGANASYDFTFQAGTLTLATNWKWEDEFYHGVPNNPIELEDAHTVGDVRISFSPPSEAWEIAAFARNVTDEEYRVYVSPFAIPYGIGNSVYAPPRWYGASLTYRFGAH